MNTSWIMDSRYIAAISLTASIVAGRVDGDLAGLVLLGGAECPEKAAEHHVAVGLGREPEPGRDAPLLADLSRARRGRAPRCPA